MRVNAVARSRARLESDLGGGAAKIRPVARPGLYIEILIQGDLEELWSKTQDPALHQRWDLRFTTIEYLAKANPADPQRFRYATRIGFGMEIVGEGESVVNLGDAGGPRTSSLRFSSEDWRSLIVEGSGYWKYHKTPEGLRFWTWYDYRTRFGTIGRVFDRLVFRPLMGWATAWSFDNLRLWIETGQDPMLTLRRAAGHWIARASLVLVLIYHGLVPKLLLRSPDELQMLRAGGISEDSLGAAVAVMGTLELVWAGVLLVCGSRRWPYLVTIAGMALALAGVAVQSPEFLGRAFNPVTLNLCVAALAAIAWILQTDLPSARRCLRRDPQRQ